jgi:hypothetical protein
MTLEEYLQQQGYVYRPENRVETDGGMSGNFGGYGKYRDVEGDIEGTTRQVFDEIERSETAKYYDDPSRFIKNRETQFGKGLNTFNEGNEDQKRIIDQINTGQLYISPRLVVGKVRGEPEGGGEGYIERKVYDLRDARTGQAIQEVTPIDAEKGIFNIFADDKNSSGFFNNYVTTDAKGFVNPIVSEQQSQYASRANSSLNFIKDSVKGLLTMAAIAATAGGAGAALGSATGLGTTGGNIALNTGINALKQGVDGQFNPLGLATSAALSYGLGGAGAEGADPLTADDMYTGQAMTNLASSDDATRLADLVRAFENPTELTGQTIDVASNPTVELGNATVDESYGLPNIPKDLQNEAYLDPGLIDVAPENVTISTPDATPYFDASPTFPTLDVSPEYDPSAYLPTNLGGYTGIPTDLGGLDVPFDTTTPTDLTAGELTVSGTQDTFDPWDNPEPLPYTPFEEDYPTQPDETVDKTTIQSPKIKLGNLLKSTSAINTRLNTAQNMQQQSNLANMLRGAQLPQTALPAIYKQQNPFNFGQQALPVQDTNALVKLLRTA